MHHRIRAAVAALGLAGAALLGLTGPSGHAAGTAGPRTVAAVTDTVVPGPDDDGPHPPLLPPATVQPRSVAPRNAGVQVLPGGGYAVRGLDLHDGMLAHWGGTYYLYGSMDGCGFSWYVQSTPWCGFGVSTASSLLGPWTAPQVLFAPSAVDPWSGLTWTQECGSTGQGCFNPRMIVRQGWGADDSVPILWFNSPIDYSRNGANAYNMMGCASLIGPCGPGAAPYGSYHKPSLSVCSGNGDFSLISPGVAGQAPAIVCTMPGAAALNLEEIDKWGANGTGTGVRSVAGLTQIEGPGGWWDATSGQYILTYSDPGCGYCTGTGSGYATAPSLYSGWTAPTNAGFGQPLGGRRGMSATSCGGQPRTVSVVDGQSYQLVDTWTGNRNETDAGLLILPLTYQAAVGTVGDGGRWVPPVSYTC